MRYVNVAELDTEDTSVIVYFNNPISNFGRTEITNILE